MNYNISNNHEWETTFVRINGGQLRLLIKDEGHDNWLVLWPGMGATAEEFISLLKQGYENGINVASFDPPGHGLSDEWQGDFTKDSIVEIWSSILSALNISKAFLGGHSYGAYAAIWSTSSFEKTIKGTILLDGGYLEPFSDTDFEEISRQNKSILESRTFKSWTQFLKEERKTARDWNPDIEHMLSATMVETNGKIVPRVSLQALNQASFLSKEFSISSIHNTNVPILLLYSSLPRELHDERIQGIERLNKNVEKLEAVAVPNSGHDLLVDNQKFVIDKIISFINIHTGY